MKLNLNATDEEIEENLKHEKRIGWLKLILGVVVVLIIGGTIWTAISYSNSAEQEKQEKENQKVEMLKQRGVPVAGKIINAWEVKSGGSTTGYKAEYQFEVKDQTYSGKGNLVSNPQSLLGGFNDIRVIYDPEDPSNNLTATDLKNYGQSAGSTTSQANPNDYKWLIKIVVIMVIGLFFAGIRFLYNKIADSFNRNF